jgi:hypothetical protein
VKRDRELRPQTEPVPVKPATAEPVKDPAPVSGVGGAMLPPSASTAATVPGQVIATQPGVGVSVSQLGSANAPQVVTTVPTLTPAASVVVQVAPDVSVGHGTGVGHPSPSTVAGQTVAASSHPVAAAAQPVSAIGIISSAPNTLPAVTGQIPSSSVTVTASVASALPTGKTMLLQFAYSPLLLYLHEALARGQVVTYDASLDNIH